MVQIRYPFIKQLCSVVRSRGGLVIADEGSTGLGRLGATFWGFQDSSVTPDIVIVSKGRLTESFVSYLSQINNLYILTL